MNFVAIVLMLSTLVILVAGLVIMASNKQKLNLKYSNKLMSLRVIFQATTIFFLALIYFLSKKG